MAIIEISTDQFLVIVGIFFVSGVGAFARLVFTLSKIQECLKVQAKSIDTIEKRHYDHINEGVKVKYAVKP